jgi:hypothetical protein
MKNIIFIGLMLQASFLFAQDDVSKVEWLTGSWTRTNVKPGRSGVEVWAKNGNELVGRGISLKGMDTTFVEKIRIVSKEGKLFYVPDVPENKGEVWFELTSVTEKGFVCENPKHDFPKKIVYEVDGKDLKATISGDGKSIDYFFKKNGD